MPYQFSSATPADEFIETLTAEWRMSAVESVTASGHYYDTFDWRLYLANLALFVESQGALHHWYLLDRSSGLELLRVESETLPAMADTLPQGALQQRLEPLIEMRSLMPLVEVTGVRQKIALLNDDDKTVVRLELLDSHVATEGEPVALPLQVGVIPLKGYQAEADQVLARLQQGEHGNSHLLDEALAAVGMKGGDYSSKLDFTLKPDERADVATKHILLHLLNTLQQNVEGTRKDIDSEFLHDLRVAVRRSRSALTQIKHVFEPEIEARFKEDLAWMGQITGATRDMDVYLLKFPDYSESLPTGYSDALEPLHRYLEAHQREEQSQLSSQLGSARFTSILSHWRTFLQQPVPQVAFPCNAVRPVAEVANARIYKMYKRVMKEGKAIHDDSHPEALHELRKSCKKLRYLMEFFQSLYPAEDIRPLIKAIKSLLDNLGDFQDLEVQANKLEGMAEALTQPKAKTTTLLAMGMLIEGLLQRQLQARLEFSTKFADFCSKENRAHFERLFVKKKSGRRT